MQAKGNNVEKYSSTPSDFKNEEIISNKCNSIVSDKESKIMR